MTYTRKTTDIIVLQRFCNQYGWEDLNTYSRPDYVNPRQSAKSDLKEYRFSEPDAPYRMINKRERIEA